jgi:hypothetical protein
VQDQHSSVLPDREAVPPADGVEGHKPSELIARFASPLLWQQRTDEREALQKVAREILCSGFTADGKMPFARLFGCGRFAHGTKEGTVPRIKGYFVPSTHRSYRTGLQHCGSKSACPCCSGTEYDLAKVDIQKALDMHRAAGKKVLFTTLTASHHHPKLDDFKSAFKEALRGFYAGKAFQAFKKRFGYIGCITAIEVTYSPENGWHFHVHILWFCDALSRADIRDVKVYVDRHWRAELRKQGLDGSRRRATDVRDSSMTADEYMAKFEHERRWDAPAELTMNQRKHGKRRGLSALDLLRVRQGTLQNPPISPDEAETLFREYAHAMAGDHMLYWSKGLREHFGLLAKPGSEEPAGDDPEEHEAEVDETEGQAGVLVDSLAPPAWNVVLANDCRPELRAAEATGDPGVVMALLLLLGLRCELVGAVVMSEGP